MTDITEKVALAILEQEWGQPIENVYEEDRQLARAAIRATLKAIREPTRQQVEDMTDTRWQKPTIDESSAERIWQRGIDRLIEELTDD